MIARAAREVFVVRVCNFAVAHVYGVAVARVYRGACEQQQTAQHRWCSQQPRTLPQCKIASSRDLAK